MQPITPQARDLLDDASRIITLATLVAVLIACVAAPLLAASWQRTPFVGFLFEPTMVISDTGDAAWPGRMAGLGHPHHVQNINGVAVTTEAEVRAVLSRNAVGQSVSVVTTLPDGGQQVYDAIVLTSFDGSDMLRSFWLPYLVGLAYLAIGSWMYRLRGSTRPGRAFSFFCFCLALVCVLLFDVSSTHAGVVLWTTAFALAGGAMMSLAMRFPQEWRLVGRWPWLLAVPYAVSLVLAGWGTLALNDMSRPWAYITVWGAIYRFAALGVVTFLVMMVYRAVTSAKLAVRQQARIVLLGSVLAFIPVTIWFLTPLLGLSIAFDTVLMLPSLLVFPLAVTVAIFRYRLLELEVIINRTIFYGALTALMAGFFSALIGAFQRFFTALTGQRSDVALVLTTLLIVAMVDVIKSRTQRVVERQFKEKPDSTRELTRFGEQVQSLVYLTDETHMARRLLDEAARSLGAQSGVVSLLRDGRYDTVHTAGRWTGDARICIPVGRNQQRLGLLSLGPRADWRPYTRRECDALSTVADHVARAILLARALNTLAEPDAPRTDRQSPASV
jgi:hypothetical protein